jgi:hypothetical protein
LPIRGVHAREAGRALVLFQVARRQVERRHGEPRSVSADRIVSSGSTRSKNGPLHRADAESSSVPGRAPCRQ